MEGLKIIIETISYNQTKVTAEIKGHSVGELYLNITRYGIRFDLFKVESNYQRKGIATKILNSAIEYCKGNMPQKRLHLHCSPMKGGNISELKLRSFYESLGFSKFNNDDENCYMEKSLV